MARSKRSQSVRNRVGSCESCGNAIPCVLHTHHCKQESKRTSYTDGGLIVLCANCHYILHHQIGWHEGKASETSKQESLKVIREYLSRYNNGCYGQYVIGF